MILKMIGGLLLAMFCGTVNAQNFVDIYILAGQSNADGRGDSDQLNSELAAPQSNASIWYNNPGNTDNVDGFRPLSPFGFSDPPDNDNFPDNTFGPELSFAGAVQTATGSSNDIGIVKVTDGGTSITDEWNSGFEAENLGTHFRALFAQVDAALAEIDARNNGDVGVVRGFLWHQGERNRNLGSYTNRLGDLIVEVRNVYGSNLPVAVGELSRERNDNTDFNTNLATFADDDPNIALVSSRDLGTIAFDSTHFNTDAQLELGQRYATAIAPLVVSQSVPEPSSLGLLAFGAIVLARRRQRKH